LFKPRKEGPVITGLELTGAAWRSAAAGAASVAERAELLAMRVSADRRTGVASLVSAGVAAAAAAPEGCVFAMSGAPHIPQKRLLSEFSFPHRPQRTYPP
jgi:hypothetical protein